MRFFDYNAVILILQQQYLEVNSEVKLELWRDFQKIKCEEIPCALLVNNLQSQPFKWLHELLTELPWILFSSTVTLNCTI